MTSHSVRYRYIRTKTILDEAEIPAVWQLATPVLVSPAVSSTLACTPTTTSGHCKSMLLTLLFDPY